MDSVSRHRQTLTAQLVNKREIQVWERRYGQHTSLRHYVLNAPENRFLSTANQA